jgi:hypothetical protein
VNFQLISRLKKFDVRLRRDVEVGRQLVHVNGSSIAVRNPDLPLRRNGGVGAGWSMAEREMELGIEEGGEVRGEGEERVGGGRELRVGLRCLGCLLWREMKDIENYYDGGGLPSTPLLVALIPNQMDTPAA